MVMALSARTQAPPILFQHRGSKCRNFICSVGETGGTVSAASDLQADNGEFRVSAQLGPVTSMGTPNRSKRPQNEHLCSGWYSCKYVLRTEINLIDTFTSQLYLLSWVKE